MTDIKKLPRLAWILAGGLGLFWGLLIYLLAFKVFSDHSRALFVLLSSALLTVLNWRTLSAPANPRLLPSWLAVAAMVLAGAAAIWLLSDDTAGGGYHRAIKAQNIYIFLLLMGATFVGGLALHYWHASARADAEEAFNQTVHNTLFNLLLYNGFLLLSVIIFALGFGLLELLHIQLWRLLGDFGQSLLVGFICSGNLLFLNLISPWRRSQSPSFLIIFPAIIVAFASVYLLALPFGDFPAINSFARLTSALLLWVLLICINDARHPRFNLVAATIGLLLTVLSWRGIAVRIDAYGLSPDRIYALIFIGLLLIGFAAIILKSLLRTVRPRWSAQVFPAMTALFGLIFVLAAFIPATRWSLDSQITRFTTGNGDLRTITRYEFETYGAAGQEAVDKIRAFYRNDPAALKVLDKTFNSNPQRDKSERQAAFLRDLRRIPADTPLPAAVEKAVADYFYRRNADSFTILTIDANHDDQPEWLVFATTLGDKTRSDYDAFLVTLTGGKPKITRLDSVSGEHETVEKSLVNQTVHYQRPQFDDVKIDGLPRLKLNRNDD